jgi:hypothetical protein
MEKFNAKGLSHNANGAHQSAVACQEDHTSESHVGSAAEASDANMLIRARTTATLVRVAGLACAFGTVARSAKVGEAGCTALASLGRLGEGLCTQYFVTKHAYTRG